MNRPLASLSLLPPPQHLKKRLQSLAMCDAILIPEWDSRYFSFNSHWASGQTMGSMRDGCGDEFFFLFDSAGVAGKTLDHEASLGSKSPSAWGQIPQEFTSFKNEPAFALAHASCYVWQLAGASAWSIAPDGMSEIPLLAFLGDGGDYYHSWAQDYLKRDIQLEAIKALLGHEPLTVHLVASLNPEIEWDSILTECEEIGYPARG